MAVKKMTSKTIVKKVIGFESGQTEKLMEIAKSKKAVEVIIKEIEPSLPGTE